MMGRFTPSRKGFTILIALGTIGILLIIVTSLASIYINEMKLSRLEYNNVLAYAQADGAFEYSMLKVANHRDGFQDRMLVTDPDKNLFSGSTDRTKSTTVGYTILSQSNDQTIALSGGVNMILPLFVGTGNYIPTSSTSIDPNHSDRISKITSLSISPATSPESLSWSIVALSGSENIGISGTGTIDGSTLGLIRFRGVDCYDRDGRKGDSTSIDSLGNCIGAYSEAQGGESVEYTYDSSILVQGFLRSDSYKNPYLLLFNSGTSDLSIHIQTDTPFTLPVLTITTEARKGNSLQSIKYQEDRSKYYDALRYGIYNKN